MAYISFEKYGPEYKQLWDTMHIIRDGAELQRLTDKIGKYKDVYQKVEKETGVPWQMIAVIHVREAGEQDIGRFRGVLHNGEMIVGTGRKTRLVPAGRGPFATWTEAAKDALHIQGFDKIKNWPVERMLWALEPFNGYGYRNKGIRSPYIWASTNHQQRGKYVRDGVYDSSVMDTQIGCAALLKYLGVTGAKPKMPTSVPVVIGTGTAVAVGYHLTNPLWLEIAVGLGVASALVYLYYKFTRKTKDEPVHLAQ